MASLDPAIRRNLEKTVIAARDLAELAAGQALARLAVGRSEPYDTLSEEERALRRALREEARRLGDIANGDDHPASRRLTTECAYEQWHRILFARFLAENRLLLHQDHQLPVSLSECEQLARELGEEDGWMLAARYAQKMLPGIFRNDDPVLQLELAPEHMQALQKLASDLPLEVFTSDDGLGWVYQFWQTKRKQEVNASGRKIGGDDLSVVTQLFTEDYMVKFLLHNTLGAWWMDRHPGAPLPIAMEYLRVGEDGKPAAGGFEGWPKTAREITIMDPCCGSGHFLVAAFEIMVAFRKAEEGLSVSEAGDAVLRDNLHGLELDPRCTEIAAFNLAMSAWKSGGYRPLPLPKIACSGLRVGGRPDEWNRIALRTPGLEAVLNQLFVWFQQAPELGSLIDPAKADGGIYKAPDWADVLKKLTAAIARFRSTDDPAASIFGEAALGAVRAAELLFGKYTLVCTNVPYLARGKQASALREYIGEQHGAAKADLATAFIERSLSFLAPGGSSALVTPQNWLFLGSYKTLREQLLTAATWNTVARLGPGAFETIGGEVVNAALIGLTASVPPPAHDLIMLDASAPRTPPAKAALLRTSETATVSQAGQLENPDARITLTRLGRGSALGTYATALSGCSAGDSVRFIRQFWEVAEMEPDWELHQTTMASTRDYGGQSEIILWQNETGDMRELAYSVRYLNHAAQNWLRGKPNWAKRGVVISQMRDLPAALYSGERYDCNCCAVVPNDERVLPALWAFCSSPNYNAEVRKINQKLNVTPGTLLSVHFDIEHWSKVAEEKYPNGLPEPYSEDPTQWLFKGTVVPSERPLHVAIARLLGYRWPDQEPDDLDELADADGIVCLPAVAGEQPAARRLEELIARAYGERYTPELIDTLVARDTHPAATIEAWLRDNFFASHCKLFHNRPFLWHIWDGRKDGFSAIVNYHKLDGPKLQKLIYSYLGAWIRDQRMARDGNEPGAEDRFLAAVSLQQKLTKILEGGRPYDIFVRWKPLHEQPIGWEPDLNDGVRMNIRPFALAGILRAKFTINWNKDRGANPAGSDAARYAQEQDRGSLDPDGPHSFHRNTDGSQRLNDIHLQRGTKDRARSKHAAAEEARVAKAVNADGLPMDPPADARADETDLFGVPRQKDLFGVIVEDDGKRRRRI